MISFVLFPEASQPSMNFNISKLVYSNYGRHDKEMDSFIYNNNIYESPVVKPCGQTRINFFLNY